MVSRRTTPDEPLTSHQRALLESADGKLAVHIVMKQIVMHYGPRLHVQRDELQSIVYEQLVLAVRNYDPAREGGLARFCSYARRYVYPRVRDELGSSRYKSDPVEVPESALAISLDELHAQNYPKPLQLRASDVTDEARLDEVERQNRTKLRDFAKKQYQRQLGTLALTLSRVRTPEEEVAQRERLTWLRGIVADAMTQVVPEDQAVLHQRYWQGMSYPAIGRGRVPPVSEKVAARMVHIAETELGGILRRMGVNATEEAVPL